MTPGVWMRAVIALPAAIGGVAVDNYFVAVFEGLS